MNTENIEKAFYEPIKSPEEDFRAWIERGIEQARQMIRVLQMETCLDYPVTRSDRLQRREI